MPTRLEMGASAVILKEILAAREVDTLRFPESALGADAVRRGSSGVWDTCSSLEALQAVGIIRSRLTISD